jgi:hypothetical protein
VARPLKGADHKIGKLDHLAECAANLCMVEKYFYVGQQCVHGHIWRHKMHHWCLECAVKIFQNQCVLDINKMNYSHLTYYQHIFKNLEMPQDVSKCWILPDSRLPANHQRPRYSALTYKSPLINRAESIMLSRFVYFLCWGDVGTLIVKRLCSNPSCWNPFHLKSVFNVFEYKNTMDLFSTTVDQKKIADYNLSLKDHYIIENLGIDPRSFIFL